MKKVYRNQNGVIFVELPESSDRENLKKATEDFLKKVLSGGSKHGYVDKTRGFRKE